MDPAERNAYNRAFVDRLLKRRPDAVDEVRRAQAAAAQLFGTVLESNLGTSAEPALDIVLETIVNRERPVLFIKNDQIATDDLPPLGIEARDLVDGLEAARA